MIFPSGRWGAPSFSLSDSCREATRGMGGSMGGAGDTGEGLLAAGVRCGGGGCGVCEVGKGSS